MPVRPDKKLAILERRQIEADLYLQGWTQCKIAEHMGVDQKTVSNDLKAIRAQWRESAIRDFDEAREIELKKIDRIEREAWAAWERSQKPLQTATTSDETHQRKTRRQMKNQNGDPRFLEQVHKCIASRRALLGLDAPIRTEIETDGFSTTERRDRIITVVAALRDRAGTATIGTGPGCDEPRRICSDSQPGALVTSSPPQLS
jgi:predicted transcriptional regulator